MVLLEDGERKTREQAGESVLGEGQGRSERFSLSAQPSHFPAVFSSALHVSPAATSQCLAEMEGSERFSVVFSKLRC